MARLLSNILEKNIVVADIYPVLITVYVIHVYDVLGTKSTTPKNNF